MPTRQSRWYAKGGETFVDVLAVVRREIWRTRLLNQPPPAHLPDLANSPDHDHLALVAAYYAA